MDERSWWSRVMTWGYALWFVAALGLLGFLAGWQVDRPRQQVIGRVLFTVAGSLVGLQIGYSVLLRHRRRRQ